MNLPATKKNQLHSNHQAISFDNRILLSKKRTLLIFYLELRRKIQETEMNMTRVESFIFTSGCDVIKVTQVTKRDSLITGIKFSARD